MFSNHIESTGTVLVTAGFVPKHAHQVPTAQSIFVAPNANESGTLEVFDGTKEHMNEDVFETTTFEMPVDP